MGANLTPLLLLAAGGAAVVYIARSASGGSDAAEAPPSEPGVIVIPGESGPAEPGEPGQPGTPGESGLGIPDLNGDGLVDQADVDILLTRASNAATPEELNALRDELLAAGDAAAGLSPFDAGYLAMLAASQEKLDAEAIRLMNEQAARDAEATTQAIAGQAAADAAYNEEFARSNAELERQGVLGNVLFGGLIALDVGSRVVGAVRNRKNAMVAAETAKLDSAAAESTRATQQAAGRAPAKPATPAPRAQTAIAQGRGAATVRSAQYSAEALEVGNRPAPKSLAAARQAELNAGRQSGNLLTRSPRAGAGRAPTLSRSGLTSRAAFLERAVPAGSRVSRLASGAARGARVAGRFAGAAGLIYGAYEGYQSGTAEYAEARRTGQSSAQAASSGVFSGAASFGSLGLVDMSISKGEFKLAGRNIDFLESWTPAGRERAAQRSGNVKAYVEMFKRAKAGDQLSQQAIITIRDYYRANPKDKGAKWFVEAGGKL